MELSVETNSQRRKKVRRKAADINRKFICEYCKVKGYGSRNALNTHVKNKHSDTSKKLNTSQYLVDCTNQKNENEDCSSDTSRNDSCSNDKIIETTSDISGSEKIPMLPSEKSPQVTDSITTDSDFLSVEKENNTTKVIAADKSEYNPTMIVPVSLLNIEKFQFNDSESGKIEMCFDSKNNIFKFSIDKIVIEIPFSMVSKISIDKRSILIYTEMIRSYCFKNGSWTDYNFLQKNKNYTVDIDFGSNLTYINMAINWLNFNDLELYKKIEIDYLNNIILSFEKDYYFDATISTNNHLFVALNNFN